jgi:hypothetical protein
MFYHFEPDNDFWILQLGVCAQRYSLNKAIIIRHSIYNRALELAAGNDGRCEHRDREFV